MAAVLSTIIAFPAHAYADTGTDAKDMKELKMTPEIRPTDAGFYVALDGGSNFAQVTDTKKVVQSDSAAGVGTATSYGTGSGGVGWVGGLKVGYNFESYDLGNGFGLQPAVEAEAYYLNSYTKQNYSTAGNYPANGFRAQYNDGAFMLNGLVRLKTGTLFTPYLGAGVGGEYITNTSVTLYDPSANAKFPLSGADDFDFAVQGIAGFDIEVAKHWDFFTEYKFIAAIDPTLSNSVNVHGVPDVANGTYSAKYEPGYIGQHLITAGLKYNF